MRESDIKRQLHGSQIFGLGTIFALSAALLAQPAAGQTTPGPAEQLTIGPLSPFGLRFSSIVSWDSNVFRLPDSAPDPQAAFGISGKSDRITTTTFGLAFDKSYALQRFVANVNQTAVRYGKFNSLDRDASDYRAEWQWQLTPRIRGTLSTDYQESAVAFQDFTVGRRLVTTSSSNDRFTADGSLFGGWHLLAGAWRSQLRNSQAFLSTPSTDQANEEIGLRYVDTSQSWITATRRWGRGLYPGQQGNLANLTDTGFRVRETELEATWIASAKSTVTGRLTRIERRYDLFSQMDFSDVGGMIRYVWLPAAGLTLDLSATRAIAPFFQLAAGASAGSTRRIDNSLALLPSWQVSPKFSLNMGVSRMVSDYLGEVLPSAGTARRDTLRSLFLGANWQPHRSVLLGATWRHDARTSTDPAFVFDDTMLGANARLAF